MHTTFQTREPRLKQGQHPDPDDPRVPGPDPSAWTARQQDAWGSAEMQAYRDSLLHAGVADVRAAVLDDLGTFFGLDREDVLRRCINWEEWSVEEWQAQRRESSDAVRDFYQTMHSWAFDLLWYSYLQVSGHAYPVSVAITRTLPRPGNGRRHLDFGSGIGATSQLFDRLGYETTLADVAPSLLEFARFRLERRGQRASYIDLNKETLEAGRYDVITAVDTLVHIPDLTATVRMLHRALKPGGLLFANFDVRPRTAENAWHLYDDDLPLRWQLQRAGFEPELSLNGMITRYRRVETNGLPHQVRGLRDAVLLRSPIRPMYRSARFMLRRGLRHGEASP